MSHGRISGEFGNNIISLDFSPPREKKKQQHTPADSKKRSSSTFWLPYSQDLLHNQIFRIQLFTHTIHGIGIFPFIYHKNQPSVGVYIIHGSYGLLLLYREFPDANRPFTASKNWQKFSRRTFWKAPNAGISRLGSPTCLYLQKLENKQIPNMLLQARRIIVASEFIDRSRVFSF